MTKASVNFKAVKSASHAVSHASRSVEPTYLLPEGKSLGTICLLDDRGNVASVIEAKKALASRQALRQGDYSPVWEGVINLPRPGVGCDVSQYKRDCKSIISEWCQSYQKMTGHTVLRADIHLDEGHVVDGETLLNAHAHVICDKTNEKGRVLKINAPELRKIQDMTAKVTGLDRGESSLKTGRKHIDHQAYKYLAERGRLETQQQVFNLKGTHENQLDIEKGKTARIQKLFTEDTPIITDLKAKLDGEPARLEAALKVQEDQLKEGYRLDRERMKEENAEALAAGLEKMYSQKDYSDLKTAHAEALTDLKTELARAAQQAVKVPSLEAQITQLTPLAEQVPDLKTKLAKAETEAGKVPELVAGAVQAQAQIDQLIPLAALVPELKTKLAEAQAKATLVDGLEKTINGEAARQAEAVKEGKAAGTPAQLIVPGTTPALRTSQSNKQEVLTPAQVVLGPNALAGLRAEQMDLEATKRAQEASKAKVHPTALPTHTKSLVERLCESWDAFKHWIKGEGGEFKEINVRDSDNQGPVVQLDDLHAVQRVGRGVYAIHQLDRLDKVPGLDDPKMTIKYKDGKGTVEGRLGKGGVGR